MMWGLTALAFFAAVGAYFARPAVERWLEAVAGPPTDFGPVQIGDAAHQLLGSLAQCALVALAFALLLAWSRAAKRWSRWASTGILLVLAADLYFADRWMIWTDSQSAVDSEPEAVRLIRAHEAQETRVGDAQPFRVHRTRIFAPLYYRNESDPNRMIEMSRWERRTIQPKYALPWGIEYTTTTGTMEIYDNQFFFGPFAVPVPPQLKQQKSFARVDRMVYFPRRGYDLWNTKYFVLPGLPIWDDEDRGTFTFLTTEQGLRCPVVAESPPDEDDFLILENPDAFPRAWIVHRADFRTPIVGLRRAGDREERMEQLMYRRFDAGLPLWQDHLHDEYPLHSMVMLETDDVEPLLAYHNGRRTTATETVRFDRYDPTVVRMRAQLEFPGFLVLGDTYFSGWTATVDGQPAPLLRANRAMRAVPLEAGTHMVEMRYRSKPFEIGLLLTAIGLLSMILLAVASFIRSRASALRNERTSPA